VGVESEQPRHERDCSAVVPVGGCGKLEGLQVFEVRGKLVYVVPGLGLTADVGTDGLIRRPGCAKNLERRQPHAACLGLHEDTTKAK